MSVRKTIWGVLVLGGAMLTGACGPTDESSSDSGEVTRAADEGGDASGRFCGGIAGVACPEGYACVDAPKDDCDPQRGGGDCAGVCVRSFEEPQPLTSCGGEPGYHYVLTDPQACEGARFKCAGGFTAFFNACGCGCKPAP